jgi:CRP/FNR family cyclic AMP-dependent transcriptional regulator
MAVSAELLNSFPMLQGLSPESLSQLASQSTLRKFSRRGVVLNAGKNEGVVCFLFEGRLQGVEFTLDGREVGLYFVEPGQFCGELGLLDSGNQPEYVVALSRSQVVFVPMLALREVMFGSKVLMSVLCHRMATRVRLMTAQRSLLGLTSTGQRVCGQLWMLTTQCETDVDMIILNPPTHQEIAIMLNLSRETVTRIFQQLQGNNIVKRDGSSRLLIVQPALLKSLAVGETNF